MKFKSAVLGATLAAVVAAPASGSTALQTRQIRALQKQVALQTTQIKTLQTEVAKLMPATAATVAVSAATLDFLACATYIPTSLFGNGLNDNSNSGFLWHNPANTAGDFTTSAFSFDGSTTAQFRMVTLAPTCANSLTRGGFGFSQRSADSLRRMIHTSSSVIPPKPRG